MLPHIARAHAATAGTFRPGPRFVGACAADARARRVQVEATMHGLIYLIGLIVVILAILSFFGLR
jgi:hypothetical protein